MQIRKANRDDCRQIAELALMAGEGIPAYFWALAARTGQDPIEVGAQSAAKEDEHFSYRNVRVAEIDGKVAGMMLAYRLPDKEDAEDLEEFPEFIRPLIELEQCVPGSYYINMLATYPKFRNQSVGTALMATVDQLATEAGCSRSSIEVFEQNEGALRLYQRLGYQIRERRKVIPHSSHPYEGDIVLLTRPVTPK
jgi:ribosomal protein S18 acetylase RimI-like enzyme